VVVRELSLDLTQLDHDLVLLDETLALRRVDLIGKVITEETVVL